MASETTSPSLAAKLNSVGVNRKSNSSKPYMTCSTKLKFVCKPLFLTVHIYAFTFLSYAQF